jgi:TolB-like protein/Tfp pilus assembly protein PilF
MGKRKTEAHSPSPSPGHKEETFPQTKTLQAVPIKPPLSATDAGKYHLLEELGRGGMGIVYKAEDTKLKRIVALKFLPPELTGDSEIKFRFINEAQTASALQHTNICTIHDIDEAANGQIFICMDYYEGESLKRKIDRGPLEVEEAVEITGQVASGLAAAHHKGIVHRDIKPANVMISADGTMKIVDFGLAKLAGSARFTKEGTTVGTVAYMSPEQARGDEVDQRTDLWALGVMCYEMISGELPFRGGTDRIVLQSVLRGRVKPLSDLVPGLPKELGRIVTRLLEKDPARRYQMADDLIADLNKLRVDEGWVSSSRARPRVARPKVRKWLVRIVPAFIAAVIPVLWFFWPLLGNPKLVPRKYETSVAVMVFQDLGEEEGSGHFASGLTDGLISQLSRVRSLRVAPYSDVLKYKDQSVSIGQIAKNLDVNFVLEGSVKIASKKLSVTARLVDGKENIVLWERNRSGELEDILALQDDLEKGVVRTLDLKISRADEQQVRRRQTGDFRAYEFFLKGKAELDKWTKDGLEKSALFFEQALKLDNRFADAYAYLALSKLVPFYFQSVLDRAVLEAVKANARRALGIDPNHEVALMDLLGYYTMKVRQGEKLGLFEIRDMLVRLKKLIKQNPASAIGIFGVAQYYGWMKRDSQTVKEYLQLALSQCERILQTDPGNQLIRGIAAESAGFLGNLAFNRGLYREAIDFTEYSLQLMPGIGRTYSQLARFYAETDQEQRAAAVRDRALAEVKYPRERGQIFMNQGTGYMKQGAFDKAAECLIQAIADFKGPPGSPSDSESLYDYALLCRYISLNRSGAGAEAETVLRDRLNSCREAPWTESILKFYAGAMKEDDLVKLAKAKWQKCEAFFYIAEKELMTGDIPRGKTFLENCVNMGMTSYVEYGIAQAELHRLIR